MLASCSRSILMHHRKLLLCALARQDIGRAREIYTSMPTIVQSEPLTRFVMYKIAIRLGEVGLAAECLEHINSKSDRDSPLLYACVLDAQQVGNKKLALAALQLVLEKYSFTAPSNVHLPALLRITIGLKAMLLDAPGSTDVDDEVETSVDQLCSLFEGGK